MRDRLIEILREPIPVIRGYDVVGESRMSIVDAERYADRLLENGAIVPPCKVGDTVYSLVQEISKIFEGRVYEIIYNGYGCVYRGTRKGYYTLAFSECDIGKTVFLTREDAEKAMKGKTKMPGYIDAGKRIKIVKVGEIRAEGKKTIPIAEKENNDERKIPCRVCEKIADANKDIFWTFARTHQPEDKDEFRRVPARFCPVCGCDLLKNRPMEEWERKENRS